MHAPGSNSRRPHPAGGYLAELDAAIAFTRSLSCTNRHGFRPSGRVAHQPFQEIIHEWARLNIVPRPDERIAGRCLEITFALLEFLAGAGVDSMYTLGWMSFSGQPVYHFTVEDVRGWLNGQAVDRAKLEMHAWVTLLSGEIIDPSWLSTVGIVRNLRHLIGAVIIADPARPTSHQYHPITVDTAILARLGLVGPSPGHFRGQQAPPPVSLAIAGA